MRGEAGEEFAMKEEEYKCMAAATVGLAQRSTSPADKARLLKLADAWLDLIERHREARRARAEKRQAFKQATYERHPAE